MPASGDRGEAPALPWGPEGLGLDEACVEVRRSLDRVRDPVLGTFAFVSPGTRKSIHRVPLRPSDVTLLRRHRLASGRPAGAFDSSEEGHALRYDAAGQVVGLTIVNARWLLERDGEITVTPPALHLGAAELAPALVGT